MPQIRIDTKKQALELYLSNELYKTYLISTALNGLGEQLNTGCTPRGWHEIKEKIGDNLALNSVLVSRKPTGETWDLTLQKKNPNRDWILTRILWLNGLEEGRNKGGNVDTFKRYIYIHGTPYEDQLGQAVSKGCIRMANNEIIELFQKVKVGTKVFIF